jgi:hypothetical protein
MDRPYILRRRKHSSTFILSIVNCAIVEAPWGRRILPLNAALLAGAEVGNVSSEAVDSMN